MPTTAIDPKAYRSLKNARVSHSLEVAKTEDAEHYRLNGRELWLTPVAVQLVVPVFNSAPTLTYFPPELAVAFARKILAFYDPDGIGA